MKKIEVENNIYSVSAKTKESSTRKDKNIVVLQEDDYTLKAKEKLFIEETGLEK